MQKLMLRNIAFYLRHKEEFKHQYADQYLIIQNEKVVGAFETWLEACERGLEVFQQENFLIKYCPKPDNRPG